MILFNKLKPDCYVESFSDINDLDRYKLIIIDVDNTLISKDKNIDNKVYDFLSDLKNKNIKVVLVSNNTRKNSRALLDNIDIDFYGFSLKPLPFVYKRIINKYNISKNDIVVIGDQIFTDILGAKFSKLKCILVEPLSIKDNIYTSLSRKIDNLVKYSLIEKGKYYDNL